MSEKVLRTTEIPVLASHQFLTVKIQERCPHVFRKEKRRGISMQCVWSLPRNKDILSRGKDFSRAKIHLNISYSNCKEPNLSPIQPYFNQEERKTATRALDTVARKGSRWQRRKKLSHWRKRCKGHSFEKRATKIMRFNLKISKCSPSSHFTNTPK